MDPVWLFPVAAVVLVLAALRRRRRTGQWRGAPATWLLIALIFAGVAICLRFGPRVTLVG